ncbi:8-amino-7-oxononanoate synthase [Novosphingobium sp. JCM 18896]|uniref:8-amino-7-oxononanoate synthase n=1 Tax=Novosphingobium sp. JCM 18896 TaxID=2989731 RepID=UPI00222324F8|nr:8-amino-7-oxononanoate synthase [Novosphingobium sp. JCM 18896]MCW1431462.1 8-amino-7-oxononanoate synthase [Novosphingobium sp. JCM 18896]
MTYSAQRNDLARLSAGARRRRLIPEVGVDFASNDYLGLGRSGLLAEAARAALDRGVSVGSGGSRLLRGNCPEHEALEAEASAFFGSESALWFATGYAANSALLSTLPQRGDLVVHDELVHASAHEGMKLGRAETVAVRHNQVDAFDHAIRRWRAEGGMGTPWLAVESLYSMDGDQAPLASLIEVADRHDGVLLIDEAHATGVFGRDGRGLADTISDRENVITLRTCGKALGAEGALVCGSAVVTDFLVNRGRGFIFSTAPSPLMAAVVRAALGLVRDRPDLREALWARVRQAETLLAPLGAAVAGSQIIPLIVGPDDRTMELAGALQAAGYDVRGIRPPTVPNGTARLRISITNNAALADIEGLAAVLAEATAKA